MAGLPSGPVEAIVLGSRSNDCDVRAASATVKACLFGMNAIRRPDVCNAPVNTIVQYNPEMLHVRGVAAQGIASTSTVTLARGCDGCPLPSL